MYCPKCGQQIPDDVSFCPACGAAVGAPKQQPIQSQPLTQPTYNTPPAGQYGYPQQNVTQPAFNPAIRRDPLNDPRGMKWFKFIIYFQLFAGAIVNLITGIQTVTGAQYGSHAYFIYSYYPGLKTLDIIFGILCIAMAVFGVYTRQRLAKFYRNGPTLYYVLMASVIVISLVYLIAASAVLDIPFGQLMNASMITQMLTSLAMIIINYVYFNRRADLFMH